MRALAPFLLLLTGFQILTAQTAFVTGSGYTPPAAIPVAPGQVVTFYVGGLPQTAAGLRNATAVLNVGGTAQTISVFSAKPVDQSTVALTVLIPFTVVPGATTSSGAPVTVTIQFGEGDGTVTNLCAANACSAPVSLAITPVLPHIITTCDTLYSSPTNPCQLAVTHQDGSLVTNSAPAKGGEVLSVWAVGLGVPASGVPAEGSGPIAMNDIVLNTGFAVQNPGGVSISGLQTPYLFAGLSSPTEGLYQINFAVPPPPPNLQSCTPTSEWFYGNGNLSVAVFRPASLTLATAVVTETAGYFAISTSSAVSLVCVSQ